MCGQFETLLYLKRLRDPLNIHDPDAVDDVMATQVVKPTLAAPVAFRHPETGALEIAPMRFGLVPLWYRGAFKDWKATTFNARFEDVADKPAFKGAYKYRRCVVPAEAFYEWSGPKTDRRKWRITRADNQALAFAGIWDIAHCTEGEMFSFAILTRDAGPDMAAIHTREPIVIAPDDWEDWMRLKPVDTARSAPLRLQAMDGEKPGGNHELF